MKLALGPLLYFWSREDTLAFYREAADWPLDIVYLGESVCARRRLLRQPEWFVLAEQLGAAGKEAIVSSQTLIESESDLKALRKLVGDGGFAVEANEWGAVRLLGQARAAFVAGPTLNAYNPDTLALLGELGARRWVAPVEMPGDALAAMPVPAGIETEVFAYGRLPLAYSARCFTARHYNLPKDDCRFRCLDHPDGLPLATREGEAFLTINGVQIQSAKVMNLAYRIGELESAGVDVLRLSPQSRHTGEVVAIFRSLVDGAVTPDEAGGRLTRLMPGAPCDGYWHTESGMTYRSRA